MAGNVLLSVDVPRDAKDERQALDAVYDAVVFDVAQFARETTNSLRFPYPSDRSPLNFDILSRAVAEISDRSTDFEESRHPVVFTDPGLISHLMWRYERFTDVMPQQLRRAAQEGPEFSCHFLLGFISYEGGEDAKRFMEENDLGNFTVVRHGIDDTTEALFEATGVQRRQAASSGSGGR